MDIIVPSFLIWFSYFYPVIVLISLLNAVSCYCVHLFYLYLLFWLVYHLSARYPRLMPSELKGLPSLSESHYQLRLTSKGSEEERFGIQLCICW